MDGQNSHRDPNQERDPNEIKQERKQRRNKRLDQIGWVLLIIAIILGIGYLAFSGNSRRQEAISYSEVVAQFERENVRSFKVVGTKLTMELYNAYDEKEALSYDLYDVQMFREDLGNLIDSQRHRGIITGYDYHKGMRMSGWGMLMPFLFLLLMLGGFWYAASLQRSMGGGSQLDKNAKFGQANIHQGVSNGKKVTFADVAGAGRKRKNCRRSFLSCAIRTNILPWGPGSPRACCWWALPVPVKRCWPRRWPARRMSIS